MGLSVDTLSSRHQSLDRCSRAGPPASAPSSARQHFVGRENDLHQPLLVLASLRQQYRSLVARTGPAPRRADCRRIAVAFYPELDWTLLKDSDREIKDGAVEMFLKSMELIGTFHPELSSGHLLEVERKMAITKKRSFERWVEKSYRRRAKQETWERRRFDRDRFWRSWGEWLSLEATHHALAPAVALLVLTGVGGWWLGSSNSSCPTLLPPPQQTGVR